MPLGDHVLASGRKRSTKRKSTKGKGLEEHVLASARKRKSTKAKGLDEHVLASGKKMTAGNFLDVIGDVVKVISPVAKLVAPLASLAMGRKRKPATRKPAAKKTGGSIIGDIVHLVGLARKKPATKKKPTTKKKPAAKKVSKANFFAANDILDGYRNTDGGKRKKSAKKPAAKRASSKKRTTKKRVMKGGSLPVSDNMIC